ncbi:hypothetical protein HXV90_18555 [Lysinibacillus sp. JK80]|uniref:hypothetical protein n=1 Tax=Lysinibacillus sp. JK80 TaxID=2749809 RepID=UPI0022B9BC00|nr:hypothetical protein [Lysinibacillus sp. JK80]WBF57677.1 hypothetical protein HXV90_18555 [Lysinibacillus sp. JK80]
MEKNVDFYLERVVDVEFKDGSVIFDLNIDHKKMLRIFHHLLNGKFEKSDYEEYCDVFKRDLIMEIIFDSTSKIIKYFDNRTTAKNKFNDLYKRIFFEDNTNFLRQLHYVTINPEIDEYLKSASPSYYKLIPRILLPWNIYGLSKVIEGRINNFENINKIFDSKKIPLFDIKNDVDRHTKQGIDDYNAYMKMLNVSKKQFNSSLNLLYFNKNTSLLDVFQLAEIVKFNYIALEKIHMDNKRMYSDIKKSTEVDLQPYVALTNIHGLLTKLFFFENIEFSILNFPYNEIIRRYNAFFISQKNYIKNKLTEELSVSNQIDIPSELVDEALLYFLLKDNELYSDYLSKLKNVQCSDDISKNAYRVAYETKKIESKKTSEQCEQSTHKNSNVNKDAYEYHEQMSAYNRMRRGGQNEQPPNSD